MALNDCRDVPVSTARRESLERLEAAAELLHGYYGDPLGVVARALADEPDFIMGHCFNAGAAIIATEKAALPLLEASVAAAEALWDRANDRERGHILAARAWLRGDFEAASAEYANVLIDYPRDSLALQFGHVLDFALGKQTWLRDRVARVLPHWDEDTPGYGFVLGMYAFGLEENGALAQAEDTGRRALEINRRDPWAVHAVAHVMEIQGRQIDGIRWLTSREVDWAPDNMFAYHNWWHLALYYLDLGEIDQALALYDRGVRPGDSTVALELVDASALLWRLHLRRVDVSERWRKLAAAWEASGDRAYYAFNDCHAMMAYVGAGREDLAQLTLAEMARGSTGWTTNERMVREVGFPLARGLHAFGRGEYARAPPSCCCRCHPWRTASAAATRSATSST
ncbi:MAG: tetratricopeptide repeat protein [Pseudomonadota bacterium]